MIPDIAFMIVVYGAARLIVAALDPYRRGGSDTMTQVATALSFVVTACAVIGLVALAVMVANSSASLSSLGG